MPATFTDIAKSRYVLLTTFTKDGRRPAPTATGLRDTKECSDRDEPRPAVAARHFGVSRRDRPTQLHHGTTAGRGRPPALRDVAAHAVIMSMNAIGGMAKPDEIASIAAFLLAPDASYVTGATVDASSGWM